MALIRVMTKNDVDAVAALDRICFSIPWTEKMFEDEMQNRLAYYNVIDEDGTIAGYCGFWSIAGEGHITNIAVHPDFRRRGLGRLLVDTIIENARKLEIGVLFLEVRQTNKPAIELYGGAGFKMIGRRRGYYPDTGEDAYLLSREI